MQERRLVAFKNKKLNGSQLRWPIHEKKFFVVVHCLKAQKHYLEGRKTKVYIDNNSLKYFTLKAQISFKELWLYNIIVSIDVKLIQKRGKDNLILDALSRRKEFMEEKLHDTKDNSIL